jgi:hypothetical protein
LLQGHLLLLHGLLVCWLLLLLCMWLQLCPRLLLLLVVCWLLLLLCLWLRLWPRLLLLLLPVLLPLQRVHLLLCLPGPLMLLASCLICWTPWLLLHRLGWRLLQAHSLLVHVQLLLHHVLVLLLHVLVLPLTVLLLLRRPWGPGLAAVGAAVLLLQPSVRPAVACCTALCWRRPAAEQAPDLVHVCLLLCCSRGCSSTCRPALAVPLRLELLLLL